MTLLDWILVLVAVIGTVHVSVLKRAYVGHWFWVASNLGLLVTKAWAGDYPMAVLFGTYLVISVVGVKRWREVEDA